MRAVFDDKGLIAKYIETEVALAKAEATCGVIPQEAADEIAEKSTVETMDFDRFRHETEIVGYPILPLVHQLNEQCGKSGGYVHWGATTQDIMDTANVLQIRDALNLIEADVGRSLRSLSRQRNGRSYPPSTSSPLHLRLQDEHLACSNDASQATLE